MEKIVIGIDFNVLTVENKKDIKRGENLISFTVDGEGKLWQSVNDLCKSAYSTDEFDSFAVTEVFNHIKPDDLVKLVLSMEDNERKVVNGIEVIRLLNLYHF